MTYVSIMERISVKIYQDGWVHIKGKHPPNKSAHENELKFTKTFSSVKYFLAAYGFRIIGVAAGKKVYPEIMSMIEQEIKQSDMMLRTVLVDFVRVSDEHERWSGDNWKNGLIKST